MALSNAEKQARFRKKLDLERRGSNVVRNYRVKLDDPAQIERVAAEVDAIVRLPIGWTEDDLDQANCQLQVLEARALWIAQPDDVPLEVDFDRIGRRYNLEQAFDDAVSKTARLRELKRQADALIGAKLDDVADAGAIGLELLKLLGKRLVSREAVAETKGNALTLIALMPEHQHPDWVMEHLAEWLRSQCNDHELAQLARLLVKPIGEQEEEG
jgi:hypothetical protein